VQVVVRESADDKTDRENRERLARKAKLRRKAKSLMQGSAKPRRRSIVGMTASAAIAAAAMGGAKQTSTEAGASRRRRRRESLSIDPASPAARALMSPTRRTPAAATSAAELTASGPSETQEAVVANTAKPMLQGKREAVASIEGVSRRADRKSATRLEGGIRGLLQGAVTAAVQFGGNQLGDALDRPAQIRREASKRARDSSSAPAQEGIDAQATTHTHEDGNDAAGTTAGQAAARAAFGPPVTEGTIMEEG